MGGGQGAEFCQVSTVRNEWTRVEKTKWNVLQKSDSGWLILLLIDLRIFSYNFLKYLK